MHRRATTSVIDRTADVITIDPALGPKPRSLRLFLDSRHAILSAITRHQTHTVTASFGATDIELVVEEEWADDTYYKTRVISLVQLVHLMLNVSDAELVEIASREPAMDRKKEE